MKIFNDTLSLNIKFLSCVLSCENTLVGVAPEMNKNNLFFNPRTPKDCIIQGPRNPIPTGGNFIFTVRKRSLGQGNVFTSVCHSVHRRGVCIQGGWADPPSDTTGYVLVGGTHPTRIHSCLLEFL